MSEIELTRSLVTMVTGSLAGLMSLTVNGISNRSLRLPFTLSCCNQEKRFIDFYYFDYLNGNL